jgi:hypothetical protein
MFNSEWTERWWDVVLVEVVRWEGHYRLRVEPLGAWTVKLWGLFPVASGHGADMDWAMFEADEVARCVK